MTRHHGKFVSYLRVSTKRQGESGLGLEAQRKAVSDFLNGGNWKLVEELVEVESGKHDHNRPALHKALEACKVYGATLVIAKLDRLSRDAGSQRDGRRHHGAGRPSRAPHDLGAHQGGSTGGQGARRQAWQPYKAAAESHTRDPRKGLRG